MEKEPKTVWVCGDINCLNVHEDESDACEICGNPVIEVLKEELFD